jgi:DDE family transposase
VELRADAGFAVPSVYDYCEAEGISYTIALITNPRLEEMAAPVLEEAKGRYEERGRKVRLLSQGHYPRREAGRSSAGSSTKRR